MTAGLLPGSRSPAAAVFLRPGSSHGQTAPENDSRSSFPFPDFPPPLACTFGNGENKYKPPEASVQSQTKPTPPNRAHSKNRGRTSVPSHKGGRKCAEHLPGGWQVSSMQQPKRPLPRWRQRDTRTGTDHTHCSAPVRSDRPRPSNSQDIHSGNCDILSFYSYN